MLDINPNQFLRHWLIGKLAVWLVALVACLIVWLPATLLVAILLGGQEPTIALRLLVNIGTLLLPGAIIGYVAGETQLSLMRDHFQWMPDRWVLLSMFGGLVGGALAIASMAWVNPVIGEPRQLMLAMPIFAFFLSLAQWFSLRQLAYDAWLWILGNTVGGVVFSGLLFLNQPANITDSNRFLLLGLWVVAALAQATVTGIVLLWLYDRPVPEDDDYELAPVYIEVRSNDE